MLWFYFSHYSHAFLSVPFQLMVKCSRTHTYKHLLLVKVIVYIIDCNNLKILSILTRSKLLTTGVFLFHLNNSMLQSLGWLLFFTVYKNIFFSGKVSHHLAKIISTKGNSWNQLSIKGLNRLFSEKQEFYVIRYVMMERCPYWGLNLCFDIHMIGRKDRHYKINSWSFQNISRPKQTIAHLKNSSLSFILDILQLSDCINHLKNNYICKIYKNEIIYNICLL